MCKNSIIVNYSKEFCENVQKYLLKCENKLKICNLMTAKIVGKALNR